MPQGFVDKVITVFDPWVNAEPTIEVDMNEKNPRSDKEQIRYINGIMKDKGYNVLFKDLTFLLKYRHIVKQRQFYQKLQNFSLN